MQYGHFDDRAREYVITRPDTPAPWVNYLGSPEYGAIISKPVGKDLAHYRSRCCHGMGYTRMLADYAGISSEATYYVPDGCAYEVWALRVTNTGPPAA